YVSSNGNNNNVASPCTDEPVTVNKADVNQTTKQTILPNDMSTLTSSFGGIGGKGTVSPFGPNNATVDPGRAAPLYTSGGVPVTFSMLLGYTAATNNQSTTVSDTGTYKWLVEYSGDTNHKPTTSACGVEKFSIDNG